MVDRSILNEIRDRISIAAFIGERVQLKRAGHNYKGLCPFHHEKTPSFNVNDEKQIFHCFGCGAGGDLFQFVMQFEGLDFNEAVELLAQRAGVEIPRDVSPGVRRQEEERARKRKQCLRVNEIAREFFAARLAAPAGARAREYLQSRGISREFWTQHFLGYADKEWDALAGHLREKGVPLALAKELGLVRPRNRGDGYYDFFRHRIVFPIVSARGEIIGFGGRALEKDEEGKPTAKYINSPDSLLYNKSNAVYGLDLAAPAIRTGGKVLLVEGYMDLLALVQAGIANVVAPLGTALTPGHVQLLSRYTKEFVLVFDGDSAGERAALRTVPLFFDVGLMPRVVSLPSGEDPDTFVRSHGADTFRSLVEGAPALFAFFVERTVARTGGGPAGTAAALKEALPALAKVADPAEQAVWRRWLARRLDVAEEALQVAPATSACTRREAPPKREISGAVARAERLLVEALLAHPEKADAVFSELGPADFGDPWCREVAGIACDAWREGGRLDVGALIDGMADAARAAEIRAIAMRSDDLEEEELSDLLRDCVRRVRQQPDDERLVKLGEEIRQAERDGDDERLIRLLEEKQRLACRRRAAG